VNYPFKVVRDTHWPNTHCFRSYKAFM